MGSVARIQIHHMLKYKYLTDNGNGSHKMFNPFP